MEWTTLPCESSRRIFDADYPHRYRSEKVNLRGAERCEVTEIARSCIGCPANYSRAALVFETYVSVLTPAILGVESEAVVHVFSPIGHSHESTSGEYPHHRRAVLRYKGWPRICLTCCSGVVP